MEPVRVRSINLSCLVGFKNNLAKTFIMTRQYVANKNHVTRSKVKVTACTLIVYIDFSEIRSGPTHKFVMHVGI